MQNHTSRLIKWGPYGLHFFFFLKNLLDYKTFKSKKDVSNSMDLEKKINNIVRVVITSLSFSLLGSLKDKTSLKYGGIIFVIYAVFGIAMLLSIANLFAPLLNMGADQNPQVIIGMLIGVYATLAIFIIPMALILIAISYLLIGRALKVSKRKYAPLTLVRYIKYLFLPLIGGIIAVLSLYNLKWLWMLVIGAALALGGTIMLAIGNLIGAALVSIGIIIILLYFIVVIYNSLRLSIGEAIFVEGEGVINALKKSWITTKGNGWELFFSVIALVFVLYVIILIFTIPAVIYSIIYMFSTMAIGSNPSPMAGIGYLSDPGYLIAILPSYLATAYVILVGNWFTVGLYNAITRKTKKK